MEAIKIITGHGRTLAGRMLHYDASNSQMREISLKTDPSCRLCGDNPSIMSPGTPSDCSSAIRQLGEMNPDDAVALIENGFEGILLDVREVEEHAAVHLEGSTLAPLSELPLHLENLPRDVPYLVYCKLGIRSAHAGQMMLDAGFQNVTNLSGGITDWIKCGGPCLYP